MSSDEQEPRAPGSARQAKTDERTVVLATGNAGKMREFHEALASFPFRLISAADAGVTRFPPEDGDTYEANAMMKAAHVATRTGLPALADDSGLEVDALGGAPGVHSARFGGDLSDGERAAHLLARLRTVADEARGARFVSVVVLATPAGEVRSFEGRSEGRILQGPRGTGGFGYDPVFFSEELGKGFGQAAVEEKRTVSHRGRALAALADWLRGPEGSSLFASRAEGANDGHED